MRGASTARISPASIPLPRLTSFRPTGFLRLWSPNASILLTSPRRRSIPWMPPRGRSTHTGAPANASRNASASELAQVVPQPVEVQVSKPDPPDHPRRTHGAGEGRAGSLPASDAPTDERGRARRSSSAPRSPSRSATSSSERSAAKESQSARSPRRSPSRPARRRRPNRSARSPPAVRWCRLAQDLGHGIGVFVEQEPGVSEASGEPARRGSVEPRAGHSDSGRAPARPPARSAPTDAGEHVADPA